MHTITNPNEVERIHIVVHRITHRPMPSGSLLLAIAPASVIAWLLWKRDAATRRMADLTALVVTATTRAEIAEKNVELATAAADAAHKQAECLAKELATAQEASKETLTDWRIEKAAAKEAEETVARLEEAAEVSAAAAAVELTSVKLEAAEAVATAKREAAGAVEAAVTAAKREAAAALSAAKREAASSAMAIERTAAAAVGAAKRAMQAKSAAADQKIAALEKAVSENANSQHGQVA